MFRIFNAQRARTNSLEIIQRLHSTAKALLVQLELHGRLISVEWEEEMNRLQQLFVVSLIGFSCLTCCLLAFGLLVIAATWASDYRLAAIAGLVAIYAVGLALCIYKVSQVAAKRSSVFAATRKELSADLALIRSHL